MGNSLFATVESTAKPKSQVPFDADLYNKDKSVFFFNVDFLYWLVNESALDYAIKMKSPAWSSSYNTCAKGDYQNAHFDWSPGFKIAFGHFNAPHYWDVFLEYTYLHSSGDDDAHAPLAASQYLDGTWSEPDVGVTPPSPLTRAKSHIRLDYNVLDWLASRRFHPNPHLRINMIAGMTSAFLYQKWNVLYENSAGENSHLRNKWQFEGLGWKLGAKLDWFLGYDLYLTGFASTGLLTGWYRNSAKQNTSALLAGVDNTIPFRDTHYHDVRLVQTSQFFGGLGWQKTFENFRTELTAGYELTFWNNLHAVYRTDFSMPQSAKQTFINSSILSLQGLTLRWNIDF